MTDIKNQMQLIILALQEFIKKNKVAQLKNFKGKINLNIDIDTLRNRDIYSLDKHFRLLNQVVTELTLFNNDIT